MTSAKKIAFLSGKVGAGKTLFAVNLSYLAKGSVYADCDVEEPNGELFYKPHSVESVDIKMPIPLVDHDLCDGCRKCVDFCAFNALAYAGERVVLFETICHSCGGCKLVCPQGAITEVEKIIGQKFSGLAADASSKDKQIFWGKLEIGEVSGIPIISDVLKSARQAKANLTFIDCPPGSSCSVIECVEEADFCVLVAEPTIFGAHNLKMVYELVKAFDKPLGVVLNQYLDDQPNPSEQFCLDNKIQILARLPFDKDLGRLNSEGQIVVKEDEKFAELFSSLLDDLLEEVQK